MPEKKSRAQSRAEIERRIVELGREHLARDGAAGLSLRAIARDMNMVSSAVYRYVATRDDLLTLLLIDSYQELADTVHAALDDIDPDSHRQRLMLACKAFRSWAVAEPARYALLYGSPVPGYRAPAEQTVAPGTAVVALLLGELAAAHAAGVTADPPPEWSAPELAPAFAAIRDEFAVALPDWLFARAVGLWSGLVGAVNLEVFGQYGTDTFDRPDLLFELLMEQLLGPVLP
ncbi:TetR/AcrR family transcriptional regulator [Jongsikchunia kroppenstedtii]|uniref:TetR/AcrR family transcriptional regulator n=1 Tax=Jongsikchunia kroppenstedtii TaxID=1121721 RepID=UPI00035CB01E|nr:TetR/AcrR family transcriptional regulator [Jongsikchunia kroppenstedtii]